MVRSITASPLIRLTNTDHQTLIELRRRRYKPVRAVKARLDYIEAVSLLVVVNMETIRDSAKVAHDVENVIIYLDDSALLEVDPALYSVKFSHGAS